MKFVPFFSVFMLCAVGCESSDGAAEDAGVLVDATLVDASQPDATLDDASQPDASASSRLSPFVGTWGLTRLVVGGTSFSPESTGSRLRGDVEITELAENEGAFDLRAVITTDENLLTGAPFASSTPLSVRQDGAWIVRIDQARPTIAVYDVSTLDGGRRVELNLLPDDPDSTTDASGAATEMVLDRIDALDEALVGRWSLERFENDGLEVITNTCSELTGRFIATGSAEVSARYGFELSTDLRLFRDRACTDETTSRSDRQTGLAWLEGATLVLYSFDADSDFTQENADYTEWEVDLLDRALTLTRSMCAGTRCADHWPDTIVLQRD